MQYNTIGRNRKGSIGTINNVTNWFSSLKRNKKTKTKVETTTTSKSAWDLTNISKLVGNFY